MKPSLQNYGIGFQAQAFYVLYKSQKSERESYSVPQSLELRWCEIYTVPTLPAPKDTYFISGNFIKILSVLIVQIRNHTNTRFKSEL